MKRHNPTSVVLVAAFAAMTVASAAAANFPVGTHLVKGTLKDWKNKVLTSSAAVTIQAVATNGTVIASTKVANPSEDGYNFVLQIPLSTAATDSTAAVGDTMNCVLVQDSGLSLAVDPITVGDANAVSTVCLALVNMQEFTSTNDPTKTVSVPAEYVANTIRLPTTTTTARRTTRNTARGRIPSTRRTNSRSSTTPRRRTQCTPSCSNMPAVASTA